MSTHPLTATITRRFGGRLAEGAHDPDGRACALEAASVARGVAWTDDPAAVGLPDLRPINDGPWESDAQRTEHIVPVMVALWDWANWPDERRLQWFQRVVERTISEILPIALRAVGLDAEADRCEREPSMPAAAAARAAAAETAGTDAWAAAKAAETAAWAAETAAWAAETADWAAESAAANAANAAAKAAETAAWAATETAAWAATETADRAAADVLILACRIWREEAA